MAAPVQIPLIFFCWYKGQKVFNSAIQCHAQLAQYIGIQPGDSVVAVAVDLVPTHLSLMSQLIPIHPLFL